MNVTDPSTVIRGLVAGIHASNPRKDVDGRNRCGHDACGTYCTFNEGRDR